MEWKCRVRRQAAKDEAILAISGKDKMSQINDLVGYQRKLIKELEAKVAKLEAEAKKKPAPSEGDGPVRFGSGLEDWS